MLNVSTPAWIAQDRDSAHEIDALGRRHSVVDDDARCAGHKDKIKLACAQLVSTPAIPGSRAIDPSGIEVALTFIL